jgi:RNA polymerase sigma factor (sigma-70 family)
MSDYILPKVAAGDRDAVDECLDRYGGLVWSLARRQSANYADAEDAVQEIFVDIWRSAGRFDERVASEPTFVAMIARRRLIDRRRKRQRTVETATMSPELDPPTAATGTAAVEFREEAALARKQLESLRPDERKVIELAIDRGLTNSQIAETLEMPLGTVKTNARRGMTRLRELLGLDTRTDVPEGARP